MGLHVVDCSFGMYCICVVSFFVFCFLFKQRGTAVSTVSNHSEGCFYVKFTQVCAVRLITRWKNETESLLCEKMSLL